MPDARAVVLEPENVTRAREIERAIRRNMRAMEAYQAICDQRWKDRVAKAFRVPPCPS